jgi:uncharacterized protein YuzE
VIKISYDKEGDVLEIRFSEEAIAESEYIEESGLVVDYGKDGNIVAMEIISFSKRVRKDHTMEALSV